MTRDRPAVGSDYRVNGPALCVFITTSLLLGESSLCGTRHTRVRNSIQFVCFYIAVIVDTDHYFQAYLNLYCVSTNQVPVFFYVNIHLYKVGFPMTRMHSLAQLEVAKMYCCTEATFPL